MVIDLTFLSQVDPRVIFIIIASLIGLFSILVLFFLVKVFFWFYLPSKQKKYVDSFDYVLLALDIPKENYQSPKAVESIFTALMGAYSGPTKKDYYLKGSVQLPFSFELVSIEGYIQFLIRTPVIFRDLVEAAVFAQYPDASIVEVEDYVESVPQKWPDENYKFWGAELSMIQDDMYPIKTYPYFEHSLSQEFKDPMADLLENMSRLGPGEQSWIQIVITPTMPEWKERGEKLVKQLIGEKYTHKKTLMEKLTDPILNLFGFAADVLVAKAEPSEASSTEQINKIQNLTPGEQNVLTAIQTKLSKIGFWTKMRFIYIAEKPVFSAAKGVSGFFGAFSQFNSIDLNGFKPHKRNKTTANYFFVKRRIAKKQNQLMKEYRERIGVTGGTSKPFVLNVEELATIWHFPDINVKAPLVKKAEAKRAEPPVSLPAEITSMPTESGFSEQPADSFGPVEQKPETDGLADELKLDLSNTYFEERFAKDKNLIKKRKENQHFNSPNMAKSTSQTKKESTDDSSGVPPNNLPI